MLATWAIFAFVLADAPVAEPAGSGAAKRDAQVLLDAGLALYERHDFGGALVKFNQALATYPSPKLWFNIAQTQRELDHPVEALTAFEKFLAAASGPADALSDARRAVADLHRRLGRVHVRDAEDGIELSVDGRIIGRTPFVNDIWVTPGSHVLVAGSDVASASTTVTVAAGGSETVVLPVSPSGNRTVPVAAAAVFAEPPQEEPATATVTWTPPTPAVRRGWWLGRTWTWVAAGVAVASAGGAATFGLLMQSKYDDLNRSCGSLSATRSGCSADDLRSLDARKNTANALWIAAGASALTAGILFAVEGHTVAVAPMAGQPGLLVRGKF